MFTVSPKAAAVSDISVGFQSTKRNKTMSASVSDKRNKSPSRPATSGNGRPTAASRSASESSSTSGPGGSRLTHQSSTGSLMGNMRSIRDRDIMNLVPSAAECSYAACFCEENVWKLCDHVRTNSSAELPKTYVIFVSNKKQVGWGRTNRKHLIWGRIFACPIRISSFEAEFFAAHI